MDPFLQWRFFEQLRVFDGLQLSDYKQMCQRSLNTGHQQSNMWFLF